MCIKCNSNKNWIENIVFFSVFFLRNLNKKKKKDIDDKLPHISIVNKSRNGNMNKGQHWPTSLAAAVGWLAALHDISYNICATAEVQVALKNDLFWKEKKQPTSIIYTEFHIDLTGNSFQVELSCRRRRHWLTDKLLTLTHWK